MQTQRVIITTALLAALVSAGVLHTTDVRSSPWPFCLAALVWGIVAMTPLSFGRWSTKTTPLILTALLIRLPLLLTPIALSDDLFRYLWEGHALTLDINPYATSPSQALNAQPNDAILAQVNHPEVVTAYPPVALRLFQVLGLIAYHPLTIRVAATIADVGTAVGISAILKARRRTIAPAWVYALHPLSALESAGNAHIEAFAVFVLVMAFWFWERRKIAHASALILIGAGLKLAPLVAMPAMWRQGRRESIRGALWGALALGLIGGTLWKQIPMDGAGLGVWAKHWSFNAPFFPLVARLWNDPMLARLSIAAITVMTWCVAILRWRDPVRVAFYTAAIAFLLSPTAHPWYLLWAWVPALIVGATPWSILATTAPLGYLVFVGFDPSTGQWQEPSWLVWLVFFPFAIALGRTWLAHTNRPGPWPPD